MRGMKKLMILIVGVAGWHVAQAEGQWSHESEVSIVTISGNSESETTSGKQMTKYAREKDSATLTASHTESEQDSTLSAKASSAGLRYDRKIDGKLSGFTGHTVSSNKFSGVTQEDRSDLGLSYQISKREDQEWVAELGYQHSEFDYVGTKTDSIDNMRVFTKYSKQINESVSAGASVEYRDAFANAKDSQGANNRKLYWVDSSVHMTVLMSKILSLKLAYDTKYQNYIPSPATKHVDNTFTTALVAKF